jgi:hypothetical protein
MKKVLILACIVFCLMGLFPPWVYTFSPPGARQTTVPAGYRLIVDSPTPQERSAVSGVTIDVTRLLIQWVVLIVATGGYVYLKGHAHALRHKIKDG